MTLLSAIAKETFGLFVDDGSLAIAILAWVAIIAVLTQVAAWPSAVIGGLLFVGLVAILIENVVRRSRSV